MLAGLLWSGCAAPAPAVSNGAASPLLSRDRALFYRLPAGWIDVTSDTLASDCAVWLVRGDYAGTLTVRQVHMQSLSSGDLGGEGLLQVARLTAALETSSKPGVLSHGPDRVEVNGKGAVSYDVDYSGSGDRTRTVLLVSGGRVYAVTALVNGTAPAGAGSEIFASLQSFLAALRW